MLFEVSLPSAEMRAATTTARSSIQVHVRLCPVPKRKKTHPNFEFINTKFHNKSQSYEQRCTWRCNRKAPRQHLVLSWILGVIKIPRCKVSSSEASTRQEVIKDISFACSEFCLLIMAATYLCFMEHVETAAVLHPTWCDTLLCPNTVYKTLAHIQPPP